ncbi:MAG TPA: hypothetical protein VIP46_22615 [Pyrinomonadaceae bacterium]
MGRFHTLNESSFDTVTEASAYWIGFVMADGCVVPPHELRLFLAIADVDHVAKFRDFLGASHKIHIVKQMTRGKIHHNAGLSVRSSKLAAALAMFGVTPRKSHTAKVIGLERDRHFWRGAVDGDGCIYVRKRRTKSREYLYPAINLCGSLDMVSQFIDFVRLHLPGCRAVPSRSGPIYQVAFTFRQAARIIQILYEDCTVALDRKHAIARQALEMESYLLPKTKPQPVREARRAAGLCWQCGERPPKPGRKRCDSCLARAVKYTQGYQRKVSARLAAGDRSAVQEKECPGCHVTKPAAAFSKDLRRLDGLCFLCKPCVRLRRKKPAPARQRVGGPA